MSASLNETPVSSILRSPIFLIFSGLLAVIFLGSIDFLTGYEISFSLFYLAPIAAVSWYTGRRLGLTVSTFAALTWLAADVASGQVYSSPLINIWNTLIRFGFFALFTLLLERLRESYRRERELARTDRTTATANSRSLYERAQMELDRVRRFQHPLTFAIIDLDNFKMVNDRFGHIVGDEVLKAVAVCMQRDLRITDLVARLGGDEFAILMPETDQIGAQAAVTKIRSNLIHEMNSHHWPVTFSIGVMTYHSAPPSVEAMIHMADELMYAVKGTTKDGVRYKQFSG